ncbi:Stf0 family sulfotransferase [Ideonella sp.]|jgi:LPS sulfotransferase NodH|uniref:Stf0 family sulfotransferase n=1 Tax=Ideonella sp. TaxID=1929293 RepID=UPI0037C02C7D
MPVTLFAAAADYQLDQFLSSRKAAAHIVAPADVLQHLQALAPQAAWSSGTTLDDIPKGKKRLFIYDPLHEASLVQTARQRYPQMDVLGVLHHVIPRLACSPNGRKGEMGAKPQGTPQQHFAVVCTARTGSTFYCELLQAGGLGAPREHLRPPLVHVLRQASVAREQVFDEVLSCGHIDGLFGTKVISEFLFDTVGKAQAADTLACLHERGFKFIHLSRDLAEQAVSKYVAGRTDLWHVHGQVRSQHQARIAQVPYDQAALHQHYQRAKAETEALNEALARLPATAVLAARYEDFTSQPLTALQEAASYLGRTAALSRVDFSTLPARLSAAAPTMQAMAQRLREETQAR